MIDAFCDCTVSARSLARSHRRDPARSPVCGSRPSQGITRISGAGRTGSSLAALAQTAFAARRDVQRVLATIRSRPDEIYYAVYVRDADRALLNGDECIANVSERALPHGIDATCWVVGDGVTHYADALAERGCVTDAALLPSARGVLQLSLHAFANGDAVDTAALSLSAGNDHGAKPHEMSGVGTPPTGHLCR